LLTRSHSPYAINHHVSFNRAAEANRLSIVNLIFDIKADLDLFTTNDEYGRNVFHYAVKSPDVLSILISHYEKVRVSKLKTFKFNVMPHAS
jgi:hypothetical protein